jgi:ADP-ribose pyrophosphatase YjhB (NUDIX family)
MIGASGVIFDKDNNILLLKHRFWKKDSWGLPSGYVKKREKFEDGIRREIEEETNLKVSIGKLLNLNSGFKLRVECTYIGYCEDVSSLSINSNEILEAKFFSINNLSEGLLENHIKLIHLAIQLP